MDEVKILELELELQMCGDISDEEDNPIPKVPYNVLKPQSTKFEETDIS